MDAKEIVNYYDDFVVKQQDSNINDRIYSLYQRLKVWGLKSSSNLLELGCGIGTLTYLLSKHITTGYIEAVDISPKSIAYAKQKLPERILLQAHDVVTYKPQTNNFDYITLFDVIEHIPVEQHEKLFQQIASYMNSNSLLMINIPNPDYIEYDRVYQPDVLQVVDQPIHMSFLLPLLLSNGLEIIFFEKYSIWVKHDYCFYVIRKQQAFTEQKISEQRTLLEKAIKKLQRMYIAFRHKY